MADQFIRVRLTRIDNVNLNLFEFDYDLTLMIFFMTAEEKVYSRYGGRDAVNADNRHTLDGLRYTMQSVLAMHGQAKREFAPRSVQADSVSRGGKGGKGGKGCMYCHQVREAFDANLKSAGQWSRDMIWRYPLPENVGLHLDVDRGNQVAKVKANSPADVAGLKTGDVVRRLQGVPIHSFGDATLALDRAPKSGAIDIVWQRGQEIMESRLTVEDGWRKSDISWRPSLRRLVPTARLSGTDLTAAERQALGLTPKQLAFRHKDTVLPQAKAAGVKPGDIIVGFDGRQPDMDYFGFHTFVRRSFLIGDQIRLMVLRDGQRLELPMTLTK